MPDPAVGWIRVRAIALAFIAVGALLVGVACIKLALLLEDVHDDQECNLTLNEDMRRATGLGLAAVAEDDSEELLEQASIMRNLANTECP